MAFCVDLDAGSGNQYTPTLFDINLATYTKAPRDVKIDIFDDDFSRTADSQILDFQKRLLLHIFPNWYLLHTDPSTPY